MGRSSLANATITSIRARPTTIRRKVSEGHPTPKTKRWSAEVTKHSDALELDDGVFKQGDPVAIAASLKRSANSASAVRGAVPIRHVHADLLHQPGRGNLAKAECVRLEAAKRELRKAFGRAEA